ncbi:MAG TPA: 16S rRNA (adenine(1518)-N(6)/adenine(1519)-N(6))-dimethyltransferase RsmA [Thermoplasmata archaeon]|nr:16S rRNA (adenine(1518)-N(6)/adenine(1519)-N(6))-dimethyltransferase RsmA [Thermoplasmata archaeon]
MSTTSTGSSSRRSPRPAPSPVPHRADDVRRTLEALGVVPAKRWGQSFLLDPFVADAEAALAGVVPGQPIVEIGGGLGVLTEALLRRGLGPITVVERDPRLARFLARTFGDRIELRVADATSATLPRAEAVVGNLPYSVGTPILRRLLEARTPRVVVLLQREVAERLAAEPGSKQYGRLAIGARLYGTPELFRIVPPESFWPRPEVESRLLVHSARPGPLPVPSVAEFERAVRVLFSSRRKQLGNLLPRLAGARSNADRLAAAAGWPADWRTRRPETLPPEAFFALASARASGP